MFGKGRCTHGLISAVAVAMASFAGLTAITLTTTVQAQAQVRYERYPFLHKHYHGGRGFFQDLFGGFNEHHYAPQVEQAPQHVDHSHAPPPPKANPNVKPSTTVVVMGDGMADWLGYGLEYTFSDTPAVAIVRDVKQRSGLIRYEAKSDLDWWHVARDDLSQSKVNYVVMMLGVNDRKNISEKNVAKEAEKRKAEKEAKDNPANGASSAKSATDQKQVDQNSMMVQGTTPSKSANGVIEFRSERWARIYSRRIEETIAALKSKGVPVFWVGLPSIRGTKSTADAVYLNDLYRAAAERAGIDYIDVWDGFVDDSGKYSSYGPDYEGQTRRLRSSDGVFFTKYGARKLAHYIEREIRRYMSNRALTVSLPTGPLPVPGGKSAVRPTVGPVIPLTTAIGNTNELLGGASSRLVHSDTTANDVLIKGEPLTPQPGRADDFFLHQKSKADDTGKPAMGPSQSSGTTTAAAKTEARQVEPSARQIEPSGSDITKPNAIPIPRSKPMSRTEDMNGSKNGNKKESAAKPVEHTAEANKPMPPADVGSKPVHHSEPRRHSTFPFNPLGWLH